MNHSSPSSNERRPGWSHRLTFGRRSPRRRTVFEVGVVICLAVVSLLPARGVEVQLVRTPNDGIQPQASIDDRGTIHLVFYKGDPRAGDIYYARQERSGREFSEPIRVNHEPGSAIAAGTIRGAQIALGKENRLHVVWNGKAGDGDFKQAPLLYTRLNEAGTGFESERDMITVARGLDGGSSVAADGTGNVYVAWHAPIPGLEASEENRGVFLRISSDEGRTFQPERRVNPPSTGVCPCCGLKAFADRRGTVSILYRGAAQTIHRDVIHLVSAGGGAPFTIAHRHPWEVGACPMSSASLTESLDGSGTLAAWETQGNVYFTLLDPVTLAPLPPSAAPGDGGQRKHPVAVANRNGDLLLAWTEGTGWQRGGNLAWQLYRGFGEPTAQRGRAEGVPMWSLLSAVAKPNGDFVIFY